jgi:hypothetical protein
MVILLSMFGRLFDEGAELWVGNSHTEAVKASVI